MKSAISEMIDEAVKFIRTKTHAMPDIGIIIGTGLGQLADKLEKEIEIEYYQIPNFVLSTVESHAGKLIFGTIAGKNVVAMQGRFHYYEGYSMQEITFPVRVMKALGVNNLIVSNVSGTMNPYIEKGTVMIIDDHINLLGSNPLIGPNDDKLGPRFPDMSEPYSRELMGYVEEIALEHKIRINKGVYVSMTGPSLETRAEYRFLKAIGADVVGMSTVPEVIVAVHSGMKVLGFSIPTDECFPDALKPADIKDILEVAAMGEPKLAFLIEKVIEKII